MNVSGTAWAYRQGSLICLDRAVGCFIALAPADS
ncbi:hypothetical protein ACVWXY_001740 [Thermostichus sp. MS-CIW-39]